MKYSKLVFCVLLFTGFISAQVFVNDSVEVIKPSLTIYSYPENASVYADDSLLGTTPINIQNLKTGNRNILVMIDSVKQMNYNFDFPLKENLIVHSVLEKDYGYYTFSSNPLGANVYLNDSLYGQTPLELKLPVGKYVLKLQKPEMKDELMIEHVEQNKKTIFVNMHSKYALLNISNKNLINEFFIDDVEIPVDKIRDFKINAETRKSANKNLKVILKERNISLNEDFRFRPEKLYELKIIDDQTSPIPFLKSAIIPGWGQIDDGHINKGLIITSGFVATTTLTILAVINYNSCENDYQIAKSNYLSANNTFDAVKHRDILMNNYNSLDNARILKNISISLLAGVYLYNLIDVVLFHSRTKELKIIETDSKFSISPDLTSLRLMYQF